jgi:hypothetical protein
MRSREDNLLLVGELSPSSESPRGDDHRHDWPLAILGISAIFMKPMGRVGLYIVFSKCYLCLGETQTCMRNHKRAARSRS